MSIGLFQFGKVDSDDIKDAEWVELDGVRFVRERMGHIKEFEGMYFCSECDRMAHVLSIPNYCPNCGARLEVE